jgi:hypothetical protein
LWFHGFTPVSSVAAAGSGVCTLTFDKNMKCPHCITDFHDNETRAYIERDGEGHWGTGVCRCSACGQLIIRLFCADEYYYGHHDFGTELQSYLVRPKVAGRAPVPAEVPKEYADDYKEACLVLADSPKASAALSRRSLQHLLRNAAKVKHQDLYKEIQEVVDRGTLPSHIADCLDAVRHIGNFAAHPIKSTSTGEIVEVEAGEAEWNLDVLDSLFDFYFVSPAKIQARKNALNQKLSDAGKPTIK